MWYVPSQRVFMDGRIDVYPVELLLRGRRADLTGEYRELFAAHGIRCVVVRRESPLAMTIARDPSMTRVFADARWLVFVRSHAR